MNSLTEQFEVLAKSLNDTDQETLIISVWDAIGINGNGPTWLGQGREDEYLVLGLTDDELAMIGEYIEKEKAHQKEVWWASMVVNMGEVEMPIGGSRYATEQEVIKAKEILKIH